MQILPVLIPVHDTLLSGRIYRNTADLSEPQPGLVISGSWLTVKEQMSDAYARRLAARGFTVLTFDFTGFGESQGSWRQTEIPARKISDIAAAARFLSTFSAVRGGRVGCLAICASAQYAAAAIEQGAPIHSFASIAGWFHDTSTVAAYYGGPSGVQARIARATRALSSELSDEKPVLVPAYEPGNDRAAMFIPLDYYANPERGAIPQWRNEMNEASWLYWLGYDGLRAASRLRVPSLFVHGDECALPDNVRAITARLSGARVEWHPGFQVDFYDRDPLVDMACEAAYQHFSRTP